MSRQRHGAVAHHCAIPGHDQRLIASSLQLSPAALPELYAIYAMLGVTAAHDFKASSPESRRKLQCCLMQLSEKLGYLAWAQSGFSPTVPPLPAIWVIPEFHGFQDDVFG